MATYAIGDVQGCYRALRSLLRECGYDARNDTLWFVGDLVNRGPASLDVLRFVADLGDRARTVLGNHDLHLVASARGIRRVRTRDTFRDVLDAPDGEMLVDWLRHRPMIHRDPERRFVMVHAGIVPAWTIDDALARGAELSRALRAPGHERLLCGMYGNEPDAWRDSLAGLDRLRFITNAFTRMRYCHHTGDTDRNGRTGRTGGNGRDGDTGQTGRGGRNGRSDHNGRLDFSETGPPGPQDPSLAPWFTLRDAEADGVRIVFGHWATLQVETALSRDLHVRHVDTGCMWGGSLTALRLEDDREFSVGCEGGASPDLQ